MQISEINNNPLHRADGSSAGVYTTLRGETGSTRKPLMEKESLKQTLFFWGGLVLLFLGITFSFYLVYAFLAFDWATSGLSFFRTVLSTDPQNVSSAIGGYIELLAAILGIMITVVAIVLQLAAQRYGTSLIDLFLSDNVNRAYFILLVCSLLYSILIIFATKETFFPHFAIEILLLLTLVEIALLGPYFLFVFRFLTPTNLLTSIQDNNKLSLINATDQKNFLNLKKLQSEVASSLEQVTDTALSASTQMDRNLGLMAIDQIREMLLDYAEYKKDLPGEWFHVSSDHFIAISAEFYEEICRNKIWVEAKSFMDMDLIFKNCISNMPDAISAIAYNTRIIGESAIQNRDDDLLEMAVKFYNTFIRVSINNKNVRAIFNLFYQYRLLAESVFDYDIKLSEKILRHFKYYGEFCLGQGLGFVLFTAAFDLGGMVASAYDKKLDNIKDLLLIFMAVEDTVDKAKNMFVYTGIRNAQLILATYLLSRGDDSLLPIVVEDLKAETLSQLVKWRDGLLAVKDRKFFEITDRGYTFEYIDENQKEYLKLFYEKYILSQPAVFKQED
ncbi:MAG: DUF2254 family protein [bacterium]